MKAKAARICLFFAVFSFILGIMALCDCPTFFIGAGVLALIAASLGTRLIRAVAIILIIASVAGAYTSHQSDKERQERMRNKIEESTRQPHESTAH